MPSDLWHHQPICSLSGYGFDKQLLRKVDETAKKLLKQNRVLQADLKKDAQAIEKAERVLWERYDEFPAEFRRALTKDHAMCFLNGRCKGINGVARREALLASESQSSQPATSQPKNTEAREGERQAGRGVGGGNNLKKGAGTNDVLAEYILVVVDSAGSFITSCCRMTDICREGDTSLANRLSYSRLMAVLREDFEDTATDVDARKIVYRPKSGVTISIRNSRQLRTVVQIAQVESPEARIINMSLEPNELHPDDKPIRSPSPSLQVETAPLIQLTPQQPRKDQITQGGTAELDAPEVGILQEACTGPTPISRAAAQLRQSKFNSGSLTADEMSKHCPQEESRVVDFRETVTQRPSNSAGGINKAKHDGEAASCPQQ